MQKGITQSSKGAKKKFESESEAYESAEDQSLNGEEEEYEVEYIIDMKGSGKNRKFLVHWKGFPKSAETWEPENNLNCQDLIKIFLVNACTKFWVA